MLATLPSADPAAALSVAVDRLASQDISRCSDLALEEDLIALHRQLTRLEAQIARRIARFERVQGVSPKNADTVSWLRARCRMSASAAADRVAIARESEHLPQLREAFEAGD